MGRRDWYTEHIHGGVDRVIDYCTNLDDVAELLDVPRNPYFGLPSAIISLPDMPDIDFHLAKEAIKEQFGQHNAILVRGDTRVEFIPQPEWGCGYCGGANESTHVVCGGCGARRTVLIG